MYRIIRLGGFLVLVFSLSLVFRVSPVGAFRNCDRAEYARCSSGMTIHAIPESWDNFAFRYKYRLSSVPSVGGIMVLDPGAVGNAAGHVAKILGFFSQRTTEGDFWLIRARQANFPVSGVKVFADCGCGNVNDLWFRLSKRSFKVHFIKPPVAYKLFNQKSQKCADLNGGSTTDGTHIIEYTCSDAPNMKWKLVGVNVGPTSAAGSFYRLKNVKSGKCIDTEGRATDAFTKVVENTCSNFNTAIWQVERSLNSVHRIVNRKAARCMDLELGSILNWTDLILYDCSLDKNMFWNLIPMY